MKTLISKLATTCFVLLALTAGTYAQVSNLKEALDLALKNETIAAAGEKMKLYSASAYVSHGNKSWSFQFYGGGAELHSIRINTKGKASYSSRNKGTNKVFEDIDFSKVPAPSEVLVADGLAKAQKALEALGFKPTNSGNFQISYFVRSEYRQKEVPSHDYKVSLTIGDGKQGKTVTFKNGNIDTISNSGIRD